MNRPATSRRSPEPLPFREPWPRFDLDAVLEDLADRIARRLEAKRAPRLLTLRAAGEMIGRSPGAVGQLVKRGELRAVTCGRRVHIDMREIEEWIERCQR